MIKLYGDIQWWNMNSANEFIARLQQESIGKKRVDVHVHSYGGSVIEGNLIYNAIKNNPVPVDMYVDGLAASQASIVLMAADKVYMSDNAFIMIHAPRSCASGTAEELLREVNSLQGMTKNFVKILSAKTGKTEEDINKWMVGDNWFSADQALEAKLIDGIVDKIVVPDMDEIESPASVNIDVFYAKYTALLQTNNNDEMNKKDVIEKFALTGVTEQSTDAEVLAALETKMNAETNARTAAEASLQAEQKKKRDALINTVSSRITPEQKAQLEQIGEKAGFEALQVAIAGYSSNQTIKSMIDQGGASPVYGDQRASWGFDQYMKEDPAGLEAMARTDYERFNALYKAKYGVEAPK